MYALAIFLCLLFNPQQPNNKNAPANHKQTQTNTKTSSKESRRFSTDTPSNQSKPASESTQNEEHASKRIYRVQLEPQPPDWWYRGYVIFTAVIAGLNIGILILIWSQRNQMAKQVSEMQEARSQDQRMAKLEYRAWIQFDNITYSTKGRRLHVDIDITNVGRTPAKHVKVCWIVERRDGSPPNFDYPHGAAVDARPVFPPKNTMGLPLTTSIIMDRFLWVAMGDKRSSLFAHGRIDYEDVFGESHWMTFCHVFDVEQNRFAIYKEHNDTDD